MDDLLTPPFDTKIAVVVRDDLEIWQRLNVTAFLISGVTAAHPELVGEPYADAAGRSYLSLLGMPVLIFEGTPSAVATAHERALRRGTPLAIYTKGMFSTGHDAAKPRGRRRSARGRARPRRSRPACAEERGRPDPQGHPVAPLTSWHSKLRPG